MPWPTSSIPGASSWRPAVAAALGAALTLGLLGAPVDAQAVAPAEVLVQDDFSRSLDRGWGTTSGQQYVVEREEALRVADGVGRATLRPGQPVSQHLTVAERDVLVRSTVRLDTLPAKGTGAAVAVDARAGAQSFYQARVRFTRDAKAELSLVRRTSNPTAEEFLASTVALRGLRASDEVVLETLAVGVNPVKLYARAWKKGSARPDWQLTASDRSDRQLGATGSAGVSAFVFLDSPATGVVVDDLVVARVNDLAAVVAGAEPTPAAPSPAPATATTAAGQVGSSAVGASQYPVPSGAVYVAAKGNQTGSGTVASPYGSVAKAIASARSGSTLVLRGGTYRESVQVPFGKRLTIQAHPGEAVWFDGSVPVASWAKSGTTWVSTGWSAKFDHRVSFTAGKDESSRFVDPAYPMAGHPDQLWINGAAQRQVASAGAVKSGTFFVDTAGKRLIIGSDPTGKRVEASKLSKAIKIQGEGTVVRGLGVRRYATSTYMMGAVSAEVPKITLENVVIAENATTGLYAWNDGHRFANVTLSNNGLMGLGANKANGLVLENSVVKGNNRERFKKAPASGGVKITSSSKVLLRGNDVVDNVTNGLWFDVSSSDSQVVSNRVVGNGNTGLLIELSERFVVADNVFSRSAGTGLIIYNSGNISVWNNTFTANERTLTFFQDSRRQEVASLASSIPWVVRSITMSNNVFSYGSGNCPILTQDMSGKWSGNQFGIKLDANLHHRSSSTNPANFACWARSGGSTQSFKSLSAFTSATGSGVGSKLREGAAVVTSSYALTSTVSSSHGVALKGLPTNVASVTGKAAGYKSLGTFD